MYTPPPSRRDGGSAPGDVAPQLLALQAGAAEQDPKSHPDSLGSAAGNADHPHGSVRAAEDWKANERAWREEGDRILNPEEKRK